MVKAPILFCFVAWMEKYQGNPHVDIPRGGGAFIEKNGYGWEMFNFKRVGSNYYGHVTTMGGGIRIERLGADRDTQSISGVTVVFVANHPELGHPVVVGWYRGATVLRDQIATSRTLKRNYRGRRLEYNLVAPIAGSVLLAVPDRVFPVPDRKHHGFGQSRLWYADRPQNRKFLNSLLNYLHTQKVPHVRRYPQSKNGSGWQLDLKKRLATEKAAVNRVTRYFHDRGFTVISKERYCLGWDLEASRGEVTLLLEVKGTLSSQFVCELTPNEYAAMSGSRRDSFRLCVVTDALSRRLKPPRVFFWSKEQKCWTDGHDPLSIQELIGARVRPA